MGRGGVGSVANFLFVFDVGLSSFFVVEFSLFCLVFISTISIEFPANKKNQNLPITNRLVFSILLLSSGSSVDCYSFEFV